MTAVVGATIVVANTVVAPRHRRGCRSCSALADPRPGHPHVRPLPSPPTVRCANFSPSNNPAHLLTTMPASTLPLAPPPLLQTIAQGAPAKLARIATAVDSAPSSFTFETLGIDRAAAFGPAGMMVDATSDDDGSMMVDG